MVVQEHLVMQLKALASGASSVMVGSMLGGTDESPGTVLTKNGKRFKVYRGMASLAASIGRKSKETGSISHLMMILMIMWQKVLKQWFLTREQ